MFRLSNAELITDCLLSVEYSDDDGNDEQEQDKKTRTTGRPVKKSEKTTSKQNTKASKNYLRNPNALEKVKKLLLNSNMLENHPLIKRKGQPFQWRKL